MTLTQLKYMIAVAEAGNFTLAAEKSFVTQPTLSMQIQKLEDELSVQIFNRTKKPIRLTKVGSEILIQARKIISESKRMGDVVAQEKGFIGGTFTLGIIPTQLRLAPPGGMAGRGARRALVSSFFPFRLSVTFLRHRLTLEKKTQRGYPERRGCYFIHHRARTSS